jgi:uncharacterized protein DUF3306
MLLIWWGPQVRQFNKADPNDRQEEGMCPVLLLRYREAQKHRTAAPCLMKLGLRREVLERRERASALRCFEVVMLLAPSVLVFLATGAMAQSPEIIPPVLSSGLRDPTSVQTQAIEKLRQRGAIQSPFDAAKATPIESIGSGSDIRPFLASGVPADVTRAALRRAWSTDPAIREFIGLSENSWDFNAPGGVSGFGPLTTDASSRLLARTMEETERFDPERPGAERLTHDQAPVLTGEALQAAGPGQVK